MTISEILYDKLRDIKRQTQRTLSYFIPTICVAACSRLRRLVTVTTACARLMKASPVAESLLRATGFPLSPLSQMLCTMPPVVVC